MFNRLIEFSRQRALILLLTAILCGLGDGLAAPAD